MNGKQVLYVQTSGLDAPDRAYAPFILAMAAVAAGAQATIYFFLKGVTGLQREKLPDTRLEGYPPLAQIIDQAVQAGVTLEACEQSCMLYGLQKPDLITPVTIVGAPTLNDRLLDADAVLSL